MPDLEQRYYSLDTGEVNIHDREAAVYFHTDLNRLTSRSC